MSLARRTRTRRPLAHAALLASASFLSLTMASEAQAQCVTNNAQPIVNITADGTIVTCTGAVVAETVQINANEVDVEITGGGTNVSGGSNIFAIGDQNEVFVRAGATLTASTVYTLGANSSVLVQGDVIASGINVDGAGSGLFLDTGGTITVAPGNLSVFGSAGSSNTINLRGTLIGSNSTGSYLLRGGNGQQRVFLSGTINVQADGLAMDLGADNDEIYLLAGAVLAGGTGNNILIDGGMGTDRLEIDDSGISHFSSVGIETLVLDPGAGGFRGLSGSHADVTQFSVASGTVNVTNLAALGQATSNVLIVAGAQLNLSQTSAGSFNHVLSGSGTLALNSAGAPYTFGGTGSTFDGNFFIGAGNTAILATSDALGTATITNGGTLRFEGIDLANDISGTGEVIVTGNNNSRLSGANTFGGGLDIQGGVLDVDSVVSLGTGSITSTGAFGVLGVGNTVDEVLANNLTGNLALVKAGAGVLELTGTNSYAGGTLINGGAIRVDDFARLGSGQVLSGVDGSLILDFNGAGQLLQTTPFLTGNGAFIKEGSGDVVIDVANSYTGGTTIRAGRLGLNDGGALGTGTIQIDTGAELGVGGIVLNNDLTGSGLVRKTASNTAEFYGNNTGFTGTIRIAGGDLLVTSGDALGSGTLQIDSGTSVIVNAVADSTVAANLTGDGLFDKAGAGKVTLTGEGTQFGGTIGIQNGTLQIGGDQNIGTSPGGVFINTQGTLQIDTAGSTNLATVVYGSGNVVKTGAGTVFMTGANTYSGGTDIQQGAIRVTDVSVLGTGAITVQAGAALDLSIAGAQTLAQAVTGAGILRKSDQGDLALLSNGLAGGVDIVGGRVIISTAAALGGGPVMTAVDTQLVFDNTTTETMGNLVSGAGTLTKNGSGVLVIQNANSYTGGTIINAGRLGLNNGQGLGTGDVLVLQGAQLSLGGVTVANAISGAGQVVKTANNTGVLTGANTYSGGTDIQQGNLLVNTPGSLGSGGVAMAAGTSLIVDYGGSTAIAMANVITGTGALVKDGSGTLVIQNANSFTGGTTINAGRLGLNDGHGLGTGNVLIQQGAQLSLGGVTVANAISGAGQVVKTANIVGTLTGTNTYSGGTDIQQGSLRVTSPDALGTGTVQSATGTSLIVDYAGTANIAMANVITGTGALVKDGSGTVVMNTASNTYGGGTTINAGRLGLNFGDALGAGAVVIAGGAELGIGAVTYANATSGDGRIVKTGGGTATLTGANTHTGGLDIQGGSVAVSSTAALGTGAVSIASGASLDYTNAASATFANGLSGAGAFNKQGAGQLAFSTNFTLGSLNLGAGRTRINTVATTNITVASGAALDGTGRIVGNLVNNGTVAPGNSIGTLTVQGNYTHNANSVLEIEFDANGNIDLLDVTGNAVLNGGTLRFVAIGAAEGQGGTFLRTGGSLTGTFATVETVGAQLPLAVFYQPNAALMAPSVLTARPSTFNAQSLAAADTALGFIDSIGVVDARHGRGNRLWLSGFGAWGSRSASGSTLAYDHDTRGMSGGINLDLGSNVTLGAAFGWADGEISLGSNGGSGDQKHTLGSLTARYQGEGLTLGAGAVVGSVDQSTVRNVSFNGFAGSVDGATDSTIYGGFVEAGVPLGATGSWNFEANMRGTVIHQEQDGYTESGTSPLRLRLDDLATTSLEGQARLTATTRLWDASRGAEEDAAGLDLRLDLGGRYLGLQGERAIPVVFAVSDAGIVLQGDTRDTLQGIGGVALDYTSSSGARITLGYRGEFGRTDRHTVQAGVSFAF